MADFCSGCVEDIDGDGCIPDIEVEKIFDELKEGAWVSCLCVGCGLCAIAKFDGMLKVKRVPCEGALDLGWTDWHIYPNRVVDISKGSSVSEDAGELPRQYIDVSTISEGLAMGDKLDFCEGVESNNDFSDSIVDHVRVKSACFDNYDITYQSGRVECDVTCSEVIDRLLDQLDWTGTSELHFSVQGAFEDWFTHFKEEFKDVIDLGELILDDDDFSECETAVDGTVLATFQYVTYMDDEVDDFYESDEEADE